MSPNHTPHARQRPCSRSPSHRIRYSRWRVDASTQFLDLARASAKDANVESYSHNLPMQNDKRPSRGRPAHAAKRGGKRTRTDDSPRQHDAPPRRRRDDDDGPQPVSNDTALGYSSPRRRKSTSYDYTQKFSKVYGVDDAPRPRRESGDGPPRRERSQGAGTAARMACPSERCGGGAAAGLMRGGNA